MSQPVAMAITMPQLGESVTEGTVTRWLKNVGDAVAVDEPLLEVSTDKVDTEIPSPVAGVLLEIAAVEDDVVPVGGLLARVGAATDGAAPEVNHAPTPASVVPPLAAAAPAVAASAPQPVAGGSINVTLPALGESVTEGTVTRWLKQIGDPVAVDEPLVEVSTDKVDTEIPSPVAGTLIQVIVAEDETIDVGAVLAVVSTGESGAPSQPDGRSPATATEAGPKAARDAAGDRAAVAAATAVPAPAATAQPATATRGRAAAGPVHASPLVRRAARESGIDLETLSGTGLGGRITREDVALATAAPPPEEPQPARSTQPVVASANVSPVAPSMAEPKVSAPPPAPQREPVAVSMPPGTREHQEPLPRLRRLIATRMVDSLRVSAQLTTVVEVDVTTIAQLRSRVQSSFTSREGVRLSFLPFFARATVEALRAHPALNASLSADGTTVTHHGAEHLGIAVDTDRGLLVPVVRDASDLTLAGLARRISDLAERTRAGRVTPDDLAGATFTLTNTGSRGALFDTPIISQPQVGILGTGAVTKRAVVMRGRSDDDVIAIRSMAYFALTYDHRLIDGADAARFLATIKARLEQADFAAELGG